MEYRIIILCIMITFACKHKGTNNNASIDQVIITNEEKIHTKGYGEYPFSQIKIIDFDNNKIVQKDYIVAAFENSFEGINPNQIDSIKFVQTINIRDFGQSDLYKITISKELPEVVAKRAFLVVNKLEKKAALFFFNSYSTLKIRDADTSFFYGGTYTFRGKGYFYIYKLLDKNTFQCIFNTLNGYCENGIPIYNKGLDCISYDPFELKVQNRDINNDGLLDLTFSGKINYYCDGLEKGIGREDRRPKYQKDLQIDFLVTDSMSVFSWHLLNDSICNLVNRE